VTSGARDMDRPDSDESWEASEAILRSANMAENDSDNPIYYPNKAFEVIPCTGPGQSYVTTERESVSGEYGQCYENEAGPYPGPDIVPSSVPSKQFSTKPFSFPTETTPKNAFGNNVLGPLEGK